MKSNDAKRTPGRPPYWAPLACLGVLAGIVACGGIDERRHVPSRSDAGGESAAAGSPNDSVAGSTAEGGSGGSGGSGSGLVGGTHAGGGVSGEGSGGSIPAIGIGAAGEAGAAGQSAGGAGGDAAAGGAGGASEGGAGGEAPSTPVLDPVCGLGRVQVGAVSEWCGKVNVHLVGKSWVTDSDCTSGCRNDDAERLAYCKKFYRSTVAIKTGLDQKASGIKDWKNAGCADSSPDAPGISGEFACCALAP